MALTPSSQDAFLREVDDAVRQDRLVDAWTRYGRLGLGLLGGALILFGAWLYWQHWSVQRSGTVAEQADKLLSTIESGNPDDAALAAVSEAGQPGYKAIAALSKAAIAMQKGDANGAAKQYGDIAANNDFAQPWRDLALVRQVALNFDAMPPQKVVDTLKPLAIEGEPWFGSAGEMTAIAYMKLGKKDLAGSMFAALARDNEVPATVRSRAGQMAGLLGVDVVGNATQGREVAGQ